MPFETPDDTARLFYLSLLGIWIVAGTFFAYRNRLPTALRDAAAWVVIFVLVITAYGFKDTFLQQIYPGSAVMISDRSVSLNLDNSGHFVARAEVNGTPVRFLVDTGATQIVLSKQDAERIGHSPDKLRFLGQASTANGVVRTAPVMLDSIKIGDFIDHDVRASVNGGDLGSSLLGMSYLSRFSSWKVEGNRMILTR